jgi:hypothetical protein
MPAATWKLLLASVLYLAKPAMAAAQNPPAPPPSGEAPPAALPDDAFRSMGARPVVLKLTDGRELAVRILAVKPELLVISLSSNGQIRTLLRQSVASVRLLASTPALALLPDCSLSRPPAPPPRQRHFAVNLSLAPGFNLDADAGLFHGFANVGFVLLAATKLAIVPFSLGLGVDLPLAHNLPALRLDIFAHMNIIWDIYPENSDFGPPMMGSWMGFGAGLGLHYTWNNGLTLGFTVPLLGYAFQFGQAAEPFNYDLGSGVLNYFLTSLEALPLFYLGYRI